MAEKVQRFEARLELLRDGLGWTVVRVPFVPGEVWKTMIRLRVSGTVNRFAFRNSLFPYTHGGGYFLLVNKAMQSGGGVRLGEPAEFVLEPDMAPRPAELPDELAALLDEEEGLRAFYDSFSESMRREMGKWVLLAKTDETRMRRAEQMAERLLGAMEGERELPPVVAAAFRRRPKAKAGWETMTQLQRRQSLLAVFYYQTPEARERRVEKLCDEAEKRTPGGVQNGI
jgi:PAS domain-containing protein